MLIGTRTLFVDSPQGEQAVLVSLFQPQPSDGRWECLYEIGWPEGPQAGRMQGKDAIAALHLTLMHIGLELYGSPQHRERRLRWSRDVEGYGFPVPKGARDLLIGADAEYYGA
jgi:hypothetical protein